MRLCKITERKCVEGKWETIVTEECIFHQWNTDSEEVKDGVINFPVGIIETQSGTIKNIYSTDIEFYQDDTLNIIKTLKEDIK